jgi:hypothetical protein
MTEETTTPTPDVTEAPDMPKFKYGFAVLVTEDDNVFIEKNPAVFAIPVERESTLVEVRRYASEILMDLQAQAAAEYSALRIQALQAQDAQPSA